MMVMSWDKISGSVSQSWDKAIHGFAKKCEDYKVNYLKLLGPVKLKLTAVINLKVTKGLN